MPQIFLNHRRAEAEFAARRLGARLQAALGAETVASADHAGDPTALAKRVRACDALLALIGPRWERDLATRRTAGEPDPVVIELAAAFDRDIPVLPILLDGARLPAESRLPDDLRGLARRDAWPLSLERFRFEADALVAEVASVLGAAPAVAAPGPAAGRRDPPPAPETPGAQFFDALVSGGEGPELVVLPAGRFTMGAPADEPEREPSEGPQVEIEIARPFAIGRFCVAFAEFDLHCERLGRRKPLDERWGRGARPVVHISCREAEAYCAWLSAETGARYRLPSEAEWEYACRAGTRTIFNLGDWISTDQANFNGLFEYAGRKLDGEAFGRTRGVGAFAPNAFGLHQMHGNVWEWCQDCWTEDYAGRGPSSAAAMAGNCYYAILRGGSFNATAAEIRSAARYARHREFRSRQIGFRVVREL